MDWKSIGETLLDFAPGIGGLLLGPGGAMGGKLLAEVFGVEAEPEVVAQAIQNDPEAFNKIQDLEKTKFQERAKTTRTMLETEAVSKHTTRPKIALGAFRVVSFISIGIFSVWAVAVLRDKTALVTAIQEGWPFIVGLILPFVGWLNSYFGILKEEQKDKLGALNGQMPASTVGILSKLASKFKKL